MARCISTRCRCAWAATSRASGRRSSSSARRDRVAQSVSNGRETPGQGTVPKAAETSARWFTRFWGVKAFMRTASLAARTNALSPLPPPPPPPSLKQASQRCDFNSRHGLELSERYLVYLNARDAGSSPLDDSPAGKGRQAPLCRKWPWESNPRPLAAMQQNVESCSGMLGHP